MNLGLHNKQYLAAGEYTIADMICYPWMTALADARHRPRRVPEREALAG